MSQIDTLKKDSSISIAIITHDCSGFSGSQVVALEIANHHASLGHHVAIRAERNSDFLLPYLHENCSIAKERIDISDYDIVWSMHGHFCLNTKDLNRLKKWKGKFISIHLSGSTPAETYHHYFSARFSNARVFNCQRAMDILEHSQSVVGKSYNMKNAAPRKFHNFAPSNTVKLQKLLVVSNHLPQEVEDALKILVEQNVDVIHVGIAGSYKLIQPQDILDADAVLTIGKTAQYALCGTRPVYCYDHFGGPGWINDDNFPIAEERNFSGRCSPLKKPPNQIVNELVLGFEEAKKFVEKNWSTFSTSYNLEGFLDHVLSEVDGNLFDSDECLNLIDLMRGSMIHVNWIWGDVFSNPELIERDRQISILTQAVTERDGQIASLSQAVVERDSSLSQIYSSSSWRATKPLRNIKALLYSYKKINLNWQKHKEKINEFYGNGRMIFRFIPRVLRSKFISVVFFQKRILLIQISTALRQGCVAACYVIKGDFKGLITRYRTRKKIILARNQGSIISNIQTETTKSPKLWRWGIMTTQHTLFVAHLIAER